MKRLFTILIIAATTSSLFTGCATTPKGSPYSEVKARGSLAPSKDKGLVILYYGPQRQNTPVRVTANGRFLTGLRKTTFYAGFFAPGVLRLGAGNPVNNGQLALDTALSGPLSLVDLANRPKDYVTIDVKPGEVYYVKIKFGFASDQLRQVNEGEAMEALPFCYFRTLSSR